MSSNEIDLDLKNRENLRRSTEILLDTISDNQRIKLPKETLEQLLFEEFIYDKLRNKKVKLPIWSGDFLKKLDLREVSFEDVSWYAIALYENNGTSNYFIDEEANKTFQKIMKLKKWKSGLRWDLKIRDKYRVCYNGTNARINFMTSMEAKVLKKIIIADCDFGNMNLLHTDTNKCVDISIFYCNFSNSTLFKFPNTIRIINTVNFENVDLSEIKINGNKALENKQWFNCNLKNTKAKISFSKKMLENNGTNKELYKKYLNDYWKGCYLNGELLINKDKKTKVLRKHIQSRIREQISLEK